MEFDSIIPADDVCMAIGLVCLSQRRSLRHYLLPDGGELTVNTARNEWAIKNPDSFGSASDFARKYDIADGDDFSRAMQMVEKLYSERENLPSQFPYSPISRPVWDFTDTCHPKDTAIGCMITRIGLSMNTVRLFSLEGSLPKAKGKGSERVIAFRCGEDSDNFIAFNGKSFRQIGEPGMTVFGERRKDQVCMVYENPLDFMALMESVERNGVYPVMARRYHIILNGRKGIREACEYLKANPDFLEVRCFIPASESGTRLFAAINDAIKGTAINRSDLYRGYGSLLGRYAPKVPESYRKWRETQHVQSVKADERIVRQPEPKPKVTHTPTLGEKKSAVIDRTDGGLKL